MQIVAALNRLLVCGVLIMLAACDRGEPTVVVYVSADDYVARPILDEFQRHTGVQVLMVCDTEARKTTGLLERIRAERHAPVADVLWSSAVFGTVELATAGLLAPHVSQHTEAWPAAWRDAGRQWYAFSPRPRVLVYDPARLQQAELPATWMDLADPRWKDEIVMADPRFGTTGSHLAAMRWWMNGDARWHTWLAAMAANDLRILPGGNAAVVDAVRAGEAMLGATDADDVRAANRAGATLAMVPLPHGDAAGPMMTPNTVAIVQGAPHPATAARLADWLLSADVARMLANSVSGNVPLDPEVAADFPDLVIANPLEMNLTAVEAHRLPAIAESVRAWGSTGGR
jgi:iron(III) transport system substrate-binding protein